MNNEVRLKLLCKNYGFESVEELKTLIQISFPNKMFSKLKVEGVQVTKVISALYVIHIYLATNDLKRVVDWAWEK